MDRQMQNLESMPGGQVTSMTKITLSSRSSRWLSIRPSISIQAILQRMYRDVQEPVLNAMGGPNPFQVPFGFQEFRNSLLNILNITGSKRPNCCSRSYTFNRDHSTRSQPLGTTRITGSTCYFRNIGNTPRTWSRGCFGSRRRHVHKPWHAKSYGPDEVGSFFLWKRIETISPFQGQPNTYVADDVCSLYAGRFPWPRR